MGLSSQKIYLDNNATTPADPRVIEAMLPYFSDKFGNASSITHAFGWDAEEAVSISREQVALLMGSKPNDIYFTSGATEAVNLALLGTCKAYPKIKPHIITCKTEHKAVLDTCQQLEKSGVSVSRLEVDKEGTIDLDALEDAITEQTIMVCLMAANNEIGVIHPLKKIGKITNKHGILFMTDATQAVGKIPFDVQELGVDLATFSAHKVYGPKGVGGLFVSKRASKQLSPVFFGGGQEKGIRPGTLNVPGIVGLGKACELCAEEMEAEAGRMERLRDKLENELLKLDYVRINGSGTERLPHTTNVSFGHIDGSRLIRSLHNLALSQGSACTSGTVEPSHVLKALGHPDQLALSSLRIGLGRFNTEQEIEIAIESIKKAVNDLRLATS